MGHACGAALPVRDRSADDRVYIFYWSGDEGNEHNEIASVVPGSELPVWQNHPLNQLHYTVVEDGEITSQHIAVTDLPGAHGPSFRNTPAAAALPGGGVAVAFGRGQQNSQHFEIYLTTVGRD